NQFESLINGQELILTTGADLNLDTAEGKNHINTLIEKDVAGICIELGTHVHYIDQTIIEIANQAQFPIIVFRQFVQFVEITQDIHAFIINKHHDLLKLLNQLSTTFNELSLLPNGILKILETLHDHMDGNVVLMTKSDKSYYYPPETKS